MKLKDFRLGWRVLAKTPFHSAIMILGLTVGFAVMFLTMAFSRYEFGYDTHVPKLEQVYVVKARANWGISFWSENVPYSMKEALEKSGANLSTTAVVPTSVTMQVGDVVHNISLSVVDTGFPAVFGIQAIEGDLAAALLRSDGIILSLPTAQTLFGDGHAVGKSLNIKGQPYQVLAVVAEQPETSSLKFQALAGPKTTAWTAAQRQRAQEPWNYYTDSNTDLVRCKVYLRLPQGGDVAQLTQRIVDEMESSPLRGHLNSKDAKDVADKKLLRVAIGPLADSYLDSEAKRNSGSKGDPVSNYIMNAVGLMVLLLTAANYVNLATIRTIQRQREMAMRKVLGISPMRLVGQMLVESLLVAWLAAGMGAALAIALLPAWSDLTGHNMVVILTQHDWLIFGVIVVSLGSLVGLGGGLYPAWVALKMRPSAALGGRDNSETAGGLWLRRILTVFQFMIAMFVTGMVIAISWQINYLKKVDYGFQLDALLTITLPEELTESQIRSFQDALASQPAIKGVSLSSSSISEVEFKNTKAEPVVLRTWHVGPEYFTTVGLPAVLGRTFDPKLDSGSKPNAVVMNSLATQYLGFPDANAAVGQFVTVAGKSMQIVGISRDVSRGFSRGPINPTVYDLTAKSSEMTVNGGTDKAAAKASIERVWHQQFPTLYLVVKNLRATLELNAGGPQAILDTVSIVAIITIPLAIFSIYILSSYAVLRRAREIVIRKLYGATPADIARLLVREFAILIGIAALIGLPLAYIAGHMFVQQFADQAPIGVWHVLASMVGAVLVTVLATGRHLMIAARLSPAVVLRST